MNTEQIPHTRDNLEREKNKKKKVWIAGSVLAVLVLLGVSFLLGWYCGDNLGYLQGYEDSWEEGYNAGYDASEELHGDAYEEGYALGLEESEKGYEEGYEEGYEDGLADGTEETEDSSGVAVVAGGTESVAGSGTAVHNNTGNSGGPVVYVTATGTKYHSAGCRYLDQSCIKKKLNTAKQQGYKPCSVCNP